MSNRGETTLSRSFNEASRNCDNTGGCLKTRIETLLSLSLSLPLSLTLSLTRNDAASLDPYRDNDVSLANCRDKVTRRKLGALPIRRLTTPQDLSKFREESCFMDIKADKIAAPPSGKCDGESCARRAFRLDAQFSGPSRNGISKFSFFSFFFGTSPFLFSR